ncbi:hypothetical protein BDZ97DRAFT_1792975 [Flammula alnicola]|nr:hypothetical protein BDZ97DRAFT_1792975 [Flammula alnicola]
MAPVRLRHPKGVSTIEVSFDPSFTVQDLQQEIYAATDILPSRQILKSGYPPRALTLVPELPLQSLGLQRGDQLIVNEASDSGSPAASAPPPPRVQPPVQSTPTPASAPFQPTRQPTIPPQQQAALSQSSSGPDNVELDGSFLIHRQSISKAPQMRKRHKNNPETYNEAILGMPPSQYIATISKPTSWGGAIELSILAAHYSAEIASVDVETGRIDHFSAGEFGSPSGMRAILIYSGIHYDAATLAPMVDAPAEWHQTLFPITSTDDSDPVLIAAKKLATILRSKKAFTNTATFDLKCEECGQGLKGEKGARAHAEQTGHVRFGEY